LKVIAPLGLALPKVYHAKVARSNLHLFCVYARARAHMCVSQWQNRWILLEE